MIAPDFVVRVVVRFLDVLVGVDVNVGFDDGGRESGFACYQGGIAEFFFFDLRDDRPGVVGLPLVVLEDFGGVLCGDLVFDFGVGFDGGGGCEAEAEEEGDDGGELHGGS